MNSYAPEHARTPAHDDAHPRTADSASTGTARRDDAAQRRADHRHQDGGTPLKLRGVSLEYPDGTDEDGTERTMKALDDVDFSVTPGTFTALTGESGSGKSSLLAVAATLISPTLGSVLINGQEMVGRSDKERAEVRRNEVGFIFQQPNLIASLTAREQLLLADHVRGLRGKKLKERSRLADELLEKVGLPGQGNRRMHQLSGGQRQRVNIARALMGSPSVMVADEPTSALDHERSVEIVELLKQITVEEDIATVLVTHEKGMLEHADAVAVMTDGKLQMQD